MTLEERVAFLEGRVEEHARQTDGIREAMAHLEERLDGRLQGFEDRVDRRFEAADRRFEAVEHRLTALDDKFSRYFVWMLGAQVTTLAAVVTALVAP